VPPSALLRIYLVSANISFIANKKEKVMENRRSPGSKAFAPGKYYDKNRTGSQSQYGSYQRNDNRGPSQPRDSGDRFQNRDNGNRSFQSRDGRPGYQGRDAGGGYRKPGGSVGGGGGKFFSKGPQQRGRFPARGGPKPPWQQENRIKIVSDMQITDGKHRGKYLESTASPNNQPTPRRLREIMFKILFRRVRAGRVLDLCAGAGMIGIEAISRGSMISTFVERSARMCSAIKKNMETHGIKPGHGEICQIEVLPFLKRIAKRRRFWDVVYFAMPCDGDFDEIIDCLSRGTAINPGGTLVIEHSAEKEFPENIGVLKRWRVVAQDDSAMTFFARK
jgi:16S rRNA (guanine966-N2)-methyltransferase